MITTSITPACTPSTDRSPPAAGLADGRAAVASDASPEALRVLQGTIAVVGAGGLVGSRLLRMVQHSKCRGIGVVRSARSLARLSDLEVRLANTSQVSSLAEALSGCDTVVNAVNGDVSRVLEETRIIHNATRAAGCRLLIHLSSAVVYGRVSSPNLDDDSPPDTANWMLYARGKAASEIYLRRQMEARSDLRLVVLRPGLVWGPFSHWSGMVGEQFSQGGALLSNGGRGMANLVYVDNLVRMILAVQSRPTGPSGFYNVADPQRVSWLEYYRRLGQFLGYGEEQIKAWPDARLPLQPKLVLEWCLQRQSLYRLSRWLLPRLGLGVKAKAKKLIRGDPQPPGGLCPGLPPGPPRLTREHWALQNLHHCLPAEKFGRDYGPVTLVSLEESLAATASWLSYAGFSRAGISDQSNLW